MGPEIWHIWKNRYNLYFSSNFDMFDLYLPMNWLFNYFFNYILYNIPFPCLSIRFDLASSYCFQIKGTKVSNSKMRQLPKMQLVQYITVLAQNQCV